MMSLLEKAIHCPYCGEPLQLLVDPEEAGNSYVEDCQVCCSPMVVTVFYSSGGDLEVEAKQEAE